MKKSQSSIISHFLEWKCMTGRAFSLMEMMVVLLIVAIIAAATAPMVSKKMMRSAGSGDSPWVFTNANGRIAYNIGGNANQQVIIGAGGYNANGGPTSPRLVVSGGDDVNTPALVFANGSGGTYIGEIDLRAGEVQRATLQAGGNVGPNSVALGTGQTHNNVSGTVAIGQGVTANAVDATAVGHGAGASQEGAVAIGPSTTASNYYGIAIGRNASATGYSGIAIGGNVDSVNGEAETTANQGASASGPESIAIGSGASASGTNSIAIGMNSWEANEVNGSGAIASGDNSIAIGNGALADANNAIAIGANLGAGNMRNNAIVIGTDQHDVFIPGSLIVGGGVHVTGTFATEGRTYFKLLNPKDGLDYAQVSLLTDNFTLNCAASRYAWSTFDEHSYGTPSDRRLKNIGSKFKAGLAELRKLDLYNYTFKSDEAKNPHVGVIAQDLQKVFPDAVTTDIYGYLRIRWDEMFYAAINAIKELDARITEVAENVKTNIDKIAKLEATVEAQQKTIDELKAQNAEFEKRLAKLEKAKSK